MFRALTDSIN